MQRRQFVWNDVFAYWKQRRQKQGKALLQRFWPITSANDTDPHKVFRPREKERYKVRSMQHES
jgi:enhancer of polycomb-like protein